MFGKIRSQTISAPSCDCSTVRRQRGPYTVVENADSGEDSRQKKLLHKLRERGEYRKLAILPERWKEVIPQLRERFPNFNEVIDYLHGMFTLASLEDGVPRFDPILLSGPARCRQNFLCRVAGRFARCTVCDDTHGKRTGRQRFDGE